MFCELNVLTVIDDTQVSCAILCPTGLRTYLMNDLYLTELISGRCHGVGVGYFKNLIS